MIKPLCLLTLGALVGLEAERAQVYRFRDTLAPPPSPLLLPAARRPEPKRINPKAGAQKTQRKARKITRRHSP